MGTTVYFTFWDETPSDMFVNYPDCGEIDAARVLLAFTMMMSFPLPFFTIRELSLVICVIIFGMGESEEDDWKVSEKSMKGSDEGFLEKLIAEGNNRTRGRKGMGRFLKDRTIPDEPLQLKTPFHILMTVVIWATAVSVAIEAPSLGAVLDLNGCICGSFIAFILPSIFEMKLRGKRSTKNKFMLIIGISITILGSIFSIKKIIKEVQDGGE